MLRKSLLVSMCAVAVACSGKSGLATKPDAGPADATADLAGTAERPTDGVGAADLRIVAADAADAGLGEPPTDTRPAPDLAPDTAVGRDVPVEAAPIPDAPRRACRSGPGARPARGRRSRPGRREPARFAD